MTRRILLSNVMKILEKEKINSILDFLAEQYDLFAPVSQDGLKFEYTQVKDSSKVNLNFTNSHESPKKLFFPQYEVLFRYYADGRKEVPALETDKKRIIFGIRPCDVKALLFLDKVFDDSKYQDPYYLAKRNNTVIFALGCGNPQSTCFCTSFDIGPFAKEGSDVFVADLGDFYSFETVTDKGKEILKKLSGLRDAASEHIAKYEKLETESAAKIKRHIELQGLAEELINKQDDPMWEQIHLKCIRCGVCSFLCPTCHCFDIIDENQGPQQGARVRIWDSCMSCSFTQEASGHNSRPGGREKMRQRVMHKFSYIPQNFDTFGCVGCGRCIKNCPVRNDITKTIKKLRESKIREKR